MGPKTRQALHLALDMILDAMAEDASGQPPPKRRQPRALKMSNAGFSEADVTRALTAARKAGLL